MQLATAKLTSKAQASIPTRVRKRLGLKPGDTVAYELTEDGSITLRKATPIDMAFATAVGETLTEWTGDADEQAYANL